MTITRIDAWTSREDKVLADTVLSYIRQGKTQLSAFEEAGKKINRTAYACNFRWNSSIRKSYEKEIRDAKVNNLIKRSATGNTKKPLEEKQKPLVAYIWNTGDLIDFLQNFDRSTPVKILSRTSSALDSAIAFSGVDEDGEEVPTLVIQ